MNRLGGKEVKDTLTENLKAQVSALKTKPNLKIIVVGDNPASAVYVRNKVKYGEEVGVNISVDELDTNTSEEQLLALIKAYNEDDAIHGLFAQLPLPDHIDEKKVIELINPKKDVDGFSKTQIGNLFLGEEGLYPCTVEGIIDMLDYYNIDIVGKNVVIVGRSNIVGKPLALRLINMGATVSVCNSKTKDIKKYIDLADIFIPAIGQAKFFDESYFEDKSDLTVIDVGINRDENNKLCGDVNYENVAQLVKNITPVPGGVGVLTVVNVIKNLINTKK